MEPVRIGIVQKPLTALEVQEFLEADFVGAQTMFLGVVRDHNEGRHVEKMSYSAYEPLALKVLSEICSEVAEKCGDRHRVIVMHRVGVLKVGEASVAIGVGTPHREQAFWACRYIIEQIKTRLPVWKHEQYSDGEGSWLKGHPLSPGAAPSGG